MSKTVINFNPNENLKYIFLYSIQSLLKYKMSWKSKNVFPSHFVSNKLRVYELRRFVTLFKSSGYIFVEIPFSLFNKNLSTSTNKRVQKLKVLHSTLVSSASRYRRRLNGSRHHSNRYKTLLQTFWQELSCAFTVRTVFTFYLPCITIFVSMFVFLNFEGHLKVIWY